MEWESILKDVEKYRIVPVVKLDRSEDAEALAGALTEGGLPVAEVTFRTDAAEESIRKIKAKFPDMFVGAGTVVNLDQAKRALDAGASFIVTPGVSEKVIQFALDNDTPIFPGVCTPSEIMTILEYGLPVAKFFPAKQFGGLDTIKALGGPFPKLRFLPTGGVNTENMKEYLESPKIIAVGGSWMVSDKLIGTGRFDEIVRITREAVEAAAAV